MHISRVMGVQALDKVPVREMSVQANTSSSWADVHGQCHALTISPRVHERVGHLGPGMVSANCMATRAVMNEQQREHVEFAIFHATRMACVSERATD
jgi:hypothetical protein